MNAPEDDPLYLEIIERVALGKPTPWRLDERYPTLGPPEARFGKGDDQALLWEIYLAAKHGAPIPKPARAWMALRQGAHLAIDPRR
jgi:hypothetical protein